MASTILAFGIFFTFSSCTHLSQSERSFEDPDGRNEFHAALEAIQDELEQDPDNPALKVQKAEILYYLAQNTRPPLSRNPFYQDIREIAHEIPAPSIEARERLEEIISKAWSTEQGEGVKLLQQDENGSASNLDEGFGIHLNTIIAHFNNAITIQPDSVVTYNLKATTYYRHGMLNKAIETLQIADNHLHLSATGNNPEIREKLAYLYLESGDIEHSIDLYKQLADQNPDDTALQHGLANAYIVNRQHEQAVSLLRALIEKHPSRVEYREALATQLTFLAGKEMDRFQSSGRIGGMQADQLFTQLDEINDLFDTLQVTIPLREEETLRIAAFYKNTAIKLSRLSGTATTGAIQERIDNLRGDYYERSLPFWQQLVESNPENMDYAHHLEQVATALEMESRE